ncbi:uncharacterized protein LOC114532591 [Dendronephthya gigantea]|uniref:uncharacterized protein LOC114532591 n=1 Tax=Dendronephthya gigantea TaxID=151771 RepID=UPI0010698DE2|nr:uncharacterized protein LOC114532591 [Dendronephthya gigantea]
MDHFKLFERVTGRISLRNGEIFGKTLRDACKKTGAEYHEAAEWILISGNLEQVVQTRQIVISKFQDDGRSRKTSSSSSHGEAVTAKPSGAINETLPSIAKYIQCYHGHDLKTIEQKYQVEIIWSSDNTKVYIKPSSGVNHNVDLFNLACDRFAEVYHHFHNKLECNSFDVSQDKAGYSSERLKTKICGLPQHVPRLILEKSSDGRKFHIWGTNLALNQANEWIREQLGGVVERPRSISPKSPSKDALIHETANKLKVVVYQGDLTRAKADIIVNACNEHLDHGGGVSFAISKAGGPAIQKESDDFVLKHGALQTGDVAVTGSGYLHCKNVIHAVGPRWKKHGREKCLMLFRKLFMNVYREACKLGAKSVAMPAISSGIYGVPKEVCAQAVFTFVEEIDHELALDQSARPFEIILVNIDGEIFKTFSVEFNKWRFKGKKLQRRHSFGSITRVVKEKPVETKSVDDMFKPPKMKASLIALRQPLQTSLKDDHSPDTTSVASRSKRGCNWTSVDSSSSKSKSSPGSAVSITPGSQVKIITAGATTPSTPGTTISSTAGATTARGITNHFNRSSANTYSPDPAIPGQYGAVSSTNQTTTRNKHDSTTTVRYEENGVASHSPHSGDNSDDCIICRCPPTNPVSLPKCGHTFCKSCIETAFTYQKKCPTCQEVYGITEGDQPDGTMDVQKYSNSLPGYESYGCYVITYVIPGGLQGNNHPKPGQKFTGTKRQAFLPANKEGKVVLHMLKKAFKKKLIFTVGRSNTTGQEDCVTWNDIHHKTRLDGGPLHFGYPDPEYLKRVKDELKAKGIVPEKDIEMSVLSVKTFLSDISDTECPICRYPFTNVTALPKCGHRFCKTCIDTAFAYQKKCPVCQQPYGIARGSQPSGTMSVKRSSQNLPGYEGYGCHVITYAIPSGRQDSRHPRPGQAFSGTTRHAYLPANREGDVVLKMLRKAFDNNLIFTVGRSYTTGQDNCVTWNDIHHKTSITGGPQGFGYPDPDYLNRVKDELKAKGIFPE